MVRIYQYDECEQFLRGHVVPTDIFWKFSLDDALKCIRDGCAAGDMVLMGDLTRGVLFRGEFRNPQVIEAHVMGNALQLRSVARECIENLWQKGIEQFIIATQYKAVAGIVKRMGFEQRGYFPRAHWFDGRLVDIGVYCLEKSA